MNDFKQWSNRWMVYLNVGFLFGAALLRTVLTYRYPPTINYAMEALAVWLILLLSEPFLSRRWRPYFIVYLCLQTALTTFLMLSLKNQDFISVLYAILSLQIMQRMNPRIGAVWVALFTLLLIYPLLEYYDIGQGIAFVVIYSAMNILWASISLAIRRAEESVARSNALAEELKRNNLQLQAYSHQLEELSVARERSHLSRELHDAVTQTIFSMTLTTQSALLLLDRDPARVEGQLSRLTELAQNAISEIQLLIAGPREGQISTDGLAASVRQYLNGRHLPDELQTSLEVTGEQALQPAEEQGLFRIVQESLNNIVKHARARNAAICLHLTEPFSIEIADDGQGFDLDLVRNRGGVGLSSMQERAAAIGWELQVHSSPDGGTRVIVQKPDSQKGRGNATE